MILFPVWPDWEEAMCYSHMTFEQVAQPWRICGECGHRFPVQASLILDDYFLQEEIAWRDRNAMDGVRLRRVREIHSCPHCAHDF